MCVFVPTWGEKTCLTDTFFLFGHPFLIVAVTKSTCDMWWTSMGDEAKNKYGGGSILGWCDPCLPLEMLRGKSSWVDLAISIGKGTNIDISYKNVENCMLISIGVKINRVDRISGGRVNGLDIYIRGTTDLN